MTILNTTSLLGRLREASSPSPSGGGIVHIHTSADIPTPGGIPTFSEGTTYQIQEAIPDWPTQGVLMEDRSACVDLNMLNNTLTMAGTGTMFYGSGDVYLYGLVLDCPLGQYYDFDDPVGGEKVAIILQNQNKTCAKIGTFDNHAITVVDFFKVDNATQGLTFSGVNKLVQSVSRTAIATTEGVGFIAIDQTNMVTTFLEYDLHTLAGPPGSVGYSGLTNSGNMQAGSVGNVIGNNVVGGMTTLAGLSDSDVGYKYVNTSQVKDSTILGSGYITSELTTTIVDGVDVVLAGVYSQSTLATQASIDSAGTITTENVILSRAIATAVIVIDHVGGGSDSYIFKVQKDAGGTGTWGDIPETITPKTFQGSETVTIALKAPIEVIDGDKFRIVVRGVGTTDNLVAKQSVFTLQKA